MNPGLGCTCTDSLMCSVTVSQKPLDTGCKGLDVECAWPADLMAVPSLQISKFVCRQPLIRGFLTEMLPDGRACCLLFGIQSSEDPTWRGWSQTRTSPSDFAVVKPPGWTSAGRGAPTSEGLSLLFVSFCLAEAAPVPPRWHLGRSWGGSQAGERDEQQVFSPPPRKPSPLTPRSWSSWGLLTTETPAR